MGEMRTRKQQGWRVLPWMLLVHAVVGCADRSASVHSGTTPETAGNAGESGAAATTAGAAARRSVEAPAPLPEPPEPQCPDPVVVMTAGRPDGALCPKDAKERGLTVLDLSDMWAPVLFRPPLPEEARRAHEAAATLAGAATNAADAQPSVASGAAEGHAGEPEAPASLPGAPSYLDIYRALARDSYGDGPAWRSAREDRFFELYGIPPAFSVLRRYLDDDQRHACHERIDGSALAEMTETVREERASVGSARKRQLASLERSLEQQRARRALATLDELAAVKPWFKRQVARYRRMRATVAGITAAQEHLRCDGFLSKQADGIYDWRTADAMGAFQRRHMLLADDNLGEHTRTVLLAGSRELELRAVLRALRERVVDATGLIEDGSAREEWGTVLGHELDSPAFRVPTGKPPLENGAPDLIARFTEAAARELGWTDDKAVRAFFDTHAGPAADEPVSLRVAVALPPLPSYHGPAMELRAELDRGDVNYDFPSWQSRGCSAYRGKRKPTLTLYAKDGDKEVALIRWHTTIGGWNRERMPGGWLAMRYKESDVGPRVWRDLVAAPAWFPPASTPDNELVRRTGRGWEVKWDTLGPSYRSAYGLVMLVHHQMVQRRSGEIAYYDNGIRTHGSANYLSIVNGCSHGCHRLFNHQAVRLAAFLLQHRSFVRHGPVVQRYGRRVRAGGRSFYIDLDSRGYRYELTPPVEVGVLEGRIVGRRRTPVRGARPIRSAPAGNRGSASSSTSTPSSSTPVESGIPDLSGATDE